MMTYFPKKGKYTPRFSKMLEISFTQVNGSFGVLFSWKFKKHLYGAFEGKTQ